MPERRNSCLSARDARRASALLILVTDPKAWIHRRVESIEVLDDKSVHRRVSLDFAIPKRLGARRIKVNVDLLPYLPLTLLEKELLKNFDLRDNQGHPVAMLTKHENGKVAGDTLVIAGETLLGRALPSRVECRVRRVAEEEPESSRRELNEWSVLPSRGAEPHRRIWAMLVGDPGFMDYARTLADNFVLLACSRPRPGKRRLMKLGYEEPLEATDLGLLSRIAVAMGWKRKALRFDAPSANLAASFHLEIAAPYEMEIDSARLTFIADEADAEDPPEDSFDGPLTQRAHLYAADVPADYVGKALVYLRCRRTGFLRGTVLAGLLIVADIALGFAFFPQFTSPQNSQAAGALLLIGPTLLAVSLIRPGEHRLATSVLIGVRLSLVLQMVAAVFAASIIVGVGGDIRKTLWLVALIVAAVIEVGLVLSYLLPRPTKL